MSVQFCLEVHAIAEKLQTILVVYFLCCTLYINELPFGMMFTATANS